MIHRTDDLRIERLDVLSTPAEVIGELPCPPHVSDIVADGREGVHNILHGRDDRLVVVIGPCSIHDPEAALDYAKRLAPLREKHKAELEILMRVYFEKPRTTVGWKGMINDPYMDNSFRINDGLRTAPAVLERLLDMGAGRC